MDDELALAELLAEVLRHRGYAVDVRSDGRRALMTLRAQRYDLVVTDLMMPIMGGRELLSLMRGTPALADIPVIIITAMPENLPSTGYQVALEKPVSPDRLLDEVTRSLSGTFVQRAG